MSIERLYDFETAIENGFQTLLVAAGLECDTSSTAQTFQKTRPRCEVQFACGNAKLSYHIVSGVKRNATWIGQLTVRIISDGDDIATHRAYRAAIRNVMAGWESVTMDCHKLQNVIETSTTNEYKPAEGLTASDLIYRVDFGIDAGAWAELTT